MRAKGHIPCLCHWALYVLAAVLLPAAPGQSSTLLQESGHLFIQTFSLEETGGASQNFGVVQDSVGLIYVANFKSVLEYDGGRWRSLPHPNNLRPLSICRDSTGRIYVGFQGDLGYIHSSSFGRKFIISLRPQLPDSLKDIGFIWDTHAAEDGIYFRSRSSLYRWSPSVLDNRIGEMKVWSFGENSRLLALAEIDGTCVFWQQGQGLLTVQGDEVVPYPGGAAVADIPVRDITAYAPDTLLLSCETDGLYLLTDGQLLPFSSQANRYSRENFALTCTPLWNGDFALATRFGGVIEFDRSGAITRLLDQTTGLLDNNVTASPYVDLQGGLWISMNYGLARVETPSPIEYYDYELGLDGNILSIKRHRGRLYIGTSQGLRVLAPSDQPGRPARFEPVPNAGEQYWALFEVHGRLYSVGGSGLRQITGPLTHPRLLHSFDMAYCATLSNDSTYLFIGTYNEGVHAFRWRSNQWRYEGRISNTSRQVLLMEMDLDNNLWLMANYRHIEKVTFEEPFNLAEEMTSVSVYDTSLGLPALSHFYPVMIDSSLFVGSPAGLFRYNPGEDIFQPDSILGDRFGSGERGMWNLVKDSSGRIWFNSQYAKGACVRPGEQGEYELHYPLLRSSQSRFLSFYPEDEGRILWAGAENGRLIRYREDLEHADTVSFRALIRRVTLVEDSILFDGGMPQTWVTPRLPFDLNSLRFEFTIPRYDAPHANKYQYRLVGLNDSWSSWTNEAYRDFNSLREGRYSFEVRGHDVYYFESEVGRFEFIVLPPWYRTLWAYALYAIVTGALLYLLLKWRLHSVESQKRRLEAIVQQRTQELEDANSKIKQYNEKLAQMLDERTRHLIRSERQAVFGQMVQGIVHNLKNPLASSSMSVQLIKLAVEKSQREVCKSDDEELLMLRSMSDTIADTITWIEKANEALANMIHSLLAKSRSDKSENQVVTDLNEIVNREIDFLQADRIFKHKVDKNIYLTNEELPVRVVPGEMAQVFQNLVRNALDALYQNDEPRLTISTNRVGKTAILSVSDNGQGIPANILDKIFDPFFSTKRSESEEKTDNSAPTGTGLGLWMCQEAVKKFGGEIRVSSEMNYGTTFTVVLPVATGDESA